MRKTSPRDIKFNQPSIERLHPRQRLLSHLDSLFAEGRSVWICAPPGAGKSSLAASFAAKHTGPVVWFRIETTDSEVKAFIQNLYLAIGKKPPAADPFDQELTSLREALVQVTEQLTPDALWVWDSCERLATDSPQFQALAEFIQHTPNRLSMVFTSREQPPTPFRVLQVAQKLEVIDWKSLRLDAEETAAISKLITPDPPQDIAEWHALCDGWVAALVLLAQDNKRPQPKESEWSQELFDYLAGEMLNRMELPDQQRLMQLSVLPYVPTGVARDLLNEPDADAHLRQMTEQWHLIEITESSPPVYRFHPLLHRFLQTQLTNTLSTEEINPLRQRAADSLADFGLGEEACELRLQAQDWDNLLDEALALADSLADSGRLQTLQNWLQAIPPEVAVRSPWHHYWLGNCLRFEQPERGWPLLESAFDRFRQNQDVIGQYATWLAIVEAMLVVFEDLKPLKRWLNEYDALRIRHPRCPDTALKLKSLTLAGSVMSVVKPDHPKLKRLIRVAEIGVRLIPFRTPRQAAFTYLIMHYANTGQIGRMHAMARHLLPHIDESSLPAPLRLFAHAMIGLHQIIAGEEAPEKILTAAIALSDKIGGGMFSNIPRTYLIYYEIIDGHLDSARQNLQELVQITPSHHRMYHAANDFTQAWLEITSGNANRGLELSNLSKQMCYQLGFDFGLALNANLRAMAMTSLDNFQDAQLELEELGHLAENSGSTLLAVMHGLSTAWLTLRRDSEAAACTHLAPTLALAQQESIIAYPGFLRQVIAELALLAVKNNIARPLVQSLVSRWRLVPENLTPLETSWPWTLQVHTLGRFKVIMSDGRELGFRQTNHRRPLELLACLSALGGRDIPKSRICDRLWPETDADKANHALDNLLYRLRKLVGSDCIQIDASLISLNPALCWVDSWVLEALSADNDMLNLSPIQATNLLLETYQGDLLLGEEQNWLAPERKRLHSLFIRLAETLGCRLVSEGDEARAINLWDTALRQAPHAEILYFQLMKCYAEKGRQTEALAIYQRCRQTLLQNLGIEPGDAIRTFAQSLSD